MSLAEKLLADTEVASSLELLSAWTESQMAYRGQPGMPEGMLVFDVELVEITKE